MAMDTRGAITGKRTIHERIGRAEGLVRAVRAYLLTSVCDLADLNDWSVELTASQHADVRLAAAYASHSASEAVDLVYDAAGASAVYACTRLERCFRDIHVLTHHVGVASSNFEMMRQHMLGLDLDAR